MMARATGLEPAASGVTGRRSNQLSYARKASRTRRVRPSRAARVREASSPVKASALGLAGRKGSLVGPAMGNAGQYGAGRFDVHRALALVVAGIHELDRALDDFEQRQIGGCPHLQGSEHRRAIDYPGWRT